MKLTHQKARSCLARPTWSSRRAEGSPGRKAARKILPEGHESDVRVFVWQAVRTYNPAILAATKKFSTFVLNGKGQRQNATMFRLVAGVK